MLAPGPPGDRRELARAMGAVRYQSDVIYNMGISADDKHPTQYAVFIGQGGLGMPDRDYYLRTDAEIVATRDAYKKYLSSMLSLAGYSDADARAAKVYGVEEKIAKVSWKNEDRRDADKTFEWLDRAWTTRDPGIQFLLTTPAMAQSNNGTGAPNWPIAIIKNASG